MYSSVNGYSGYNRYNNYRPVQYSPVTNRPSTQNVRYGGTSNSIFASGMYGNRSVGDTVELSGTGSANRSYPMNETSGINGSQAVNDSSEADDTPIGDVELTEADEKIIDAAMEDADVPESMTEVAREHLSAMNNSGNSNISTTAKTDTTDKTATTAADQSKIDKLSEFIKNYYEMFGDESEEVSKSEYLKNVSQMMKADMEEQGKPYIDPNSGAFDPKSSNFYDTTGDDYVNMARAAKEISSDSGYTGTDYTKDTDALGNDLSDTATDDESDTDSIQNFEDFMTKNEDNPRYSRLSAVERQNKMYQDYKYNLV
ncbi:MAG: hypothetical protein A2104_04835 [Candidatus Melainabacteria bacterium GWF2_32_7]|nr:MAG: hypothetical protein A2104_04835 [Candidatus Melainabacteria bacterium GWF2_32_7]